MKVKECDLFTVYLNRALILHAKSGRAFSLKVNLKIWLKRGRASNLLSRAFRWQSNRSEQVALCCVAMRASLLEARAASVELLRFGLLELQVQSRETSGEST